MGTEIEGEVAFLLQRVDALQDERRVLVEERREVSNRITELGVTLATTERRLRKLLDAPASGRPLGARALDSRASKLLRTLNGEPAKTWTLTELAEILGVPRETVSNEVGRLVRRGQATRVGRGRFRAPTTEDAPPDMRRRIEGVLEETQRAWKTGALAKACGVERGDAVPVLRSLVEEGRVRLVTRGVYAAAGSSARKVKRAAKVPRQLRRSQLLD